MNKLHLVSTKKPNKEIKNLYIEAFPAIERIPLFLLKLLTKKGKADFFEIYDDTNRIGMLYIVYYKDIVFVFYLAIDNKLRGRGYGTLILDLIKDKYSENRIILNIEKLDENSANYEQRLKRKAFYEKNSFKSLEYFVKEGPEFYEMLYYSKNNLRVEKQEYEELVRNYLGKAFYGIYKIIS